MSTDVASNANACRVNSAVPISLTELTDAVPGPWLNQPAPTLVIAQTTSIASTTDSTTPMRMPVGPRSDDTCAGTGSSRGTFSSMTTNRNRTMIAPAYTMICVTAVNGASSRTYSPASAPNDVISSITLCIGFFCPTTSSDATTATT